MLNSNTAMVGAARDRRSGAGVGATGGLDRWAIAALFGGALLLATAPVPSGATAATTHVLPLSPAGECALVLPASGVEGVLGIVGGPLGSGATADVVLNYTYGVSYSSFDVSTGSVVARGCAELENRTVTASDGAFAFVPPVPKSVCAGTPNGTVCTTYERDYGPIEFEVAGGAPAGYALVTKGLLDNYTLSLVYELASVAISPAGPTVTTSVNAVTALTATAYGATGSVSTLAPELSWKVNGTGWAFSGPASGASVDVRGVDGAAVGTVTVLASAVVDGTSLPPVTSSVTVVAIATAIESAQVNRTSLDVGGTARVSLAAVGAAGFAYRASVDPGLGLAPIAASCTVGGASEGAVAVDCTALVTYPGAGIAQPTANLTNGDSTADWRFPNVTVNPRPELAVVPTAPAGYAGLPTTVEVTVANGSGSRPFSLACLAAGAGPPTCTAAPGPSWSFAPTYPSPGNYSALAWAVDADGENASTAFDVEIAAPLSLEAIRTSGGNASAGEPLGLSAVVAGGLLPLRYWWNASSLPEPIASGTSRSDGAVAVTVVPSAAGVLDVTLAVVDRLGTVVREELLVPVAAAPAVSVRCVLAPPANAVVAGTPVELAWGAFDANGAPSPEFTSTAELSVTAASGPVLAWVNASGAGPLAPFGGGVFGVPASAWIGGVLNVTVTVGSATTVSVALDGAGLPGPVGAVDLVVVPDRASVHLFDPAVARAGDRDNATLWRVADRFGNPAPGARLTVELDFGGNRTDVVVAAISLPGGASGVWVNYSAPGAASGEVTVEDAAGAVVLGPIEVPAAPGSAASGPAIEAVATAVPLGAIGVVALAVVRRRRRSRGAESDEQALRALAEGRAQAVELVRRAGAVDLAGIEAAWSPAPAPPALADWLASLVADGTLSAKLGAQGRAQFCLPSSAAPPQVTLDPEALDRSLRRRDGDLEDDRPGDGPR